MALVSGGYTQVEQGNVTEIPSCLNWFHRSEMPTDAGLDENETPAPIHVDYKRYASRRRGTSPPTPGGHAGMLPRGQRDGHFGHLLIFSGR